MDYLQKPCLPAVTTGALFIAILFLDLVNRDWRRVPGHALFGVFSLLLIQFICEKGSDGVAWAILAFPVTFIFLGYVFRVGYSQPQVSEITDSTGTTWEQSMEECPCPNCPCCHHSPCTCMRPCWKPKPWPAGCKPKKKEC